MSSTHEVPHGPGRVLARGTPLTSADWAVLSRMMSRRVSGVTPSRKNNASIRWRTKAERDLHALLETDPTILSYEAMPEKVAISVEGKTRVHIPSLGVTMRRGRAILDVFRSLEDPWAAEARLARQLADHYADRRIPFRALEHADIRLEPRLRNAKHVVIQARQHADERLDLLAVEAFTRQDGMTLRDIRRMAPNEPGIEAAVCSQVIAGVLSADLSAGCTDEMMVSLYAPDVR